MDLLNQFISNLGISNTTLIFLIIIAFSAGFIDSVVGGGGLIMLPGLFNFLPNIQIPSLLGTNKIVSITGTSLAAYNYSKNLKFNWYWLLPAFAGAIIFAIAGGWLATVVPTQIFRPIILGFLLWVFYLSFFNQKLSSDKLENKNNQNIKMIIFCSVIGFYDGLIGPGTGVFLIFGMVKFFNYNFLQASANAKIINVGSNLGALIFFIPNGYFLGQIALILIFCNMVGALLGSSLAIARGSKFVKFIFQIMVIVLLAKFIYDSIVILF